MKKFLQKITFFLALLVFLNAPSSGAEKLVVGALPVTSADFLELVKDDLKAQGVELEIRIFNDYVQPNFATESGDLDVNFFQHIPYLNAYNAENNGHLVPLASIYLSPMGVYSNKHKSFDVKEGAVIAVPNDTTNETRALDIIAQVGLVKFKEGPFKTQLDIIDNPKKIVIKELEAAQVPRALPDVDFAIINANYAIDAGLNPVKDSVLLESAENNPYVNVLVVKAGNENLPKIKALVKALQTQKIKDYMAKQYQGALVPSF